MFDDATEAFYSDYFQPHDGFAFGLVTNKVRADKSWGSVRSRAGAPELLLSWLSRSIATKSDAHLCIGLVPDEHVKSDHTFEPKKVPESDAISRVFCVDIDVHHDSDKRRKKSDYADQSEVQEALDTAFEKGMPMPDYLVYSGSGGVHLWYFCVNYIDGQTHRRVRNALHKSLTDFGLKFDTSKGTVTSRLRAPGSFNSKPHLRALTRVKKLNQKIRSLRKLQKGFGFNVQVRSSFGRDVEQAHRENAEYDPYTEYSSDDVKQACSYMVYQLATGSKDLDRDQWMGVASVVRHLKGWPDAWRAACHTHYGDVTDVQLDHALDPDVGLRGPISCIAIGGGIGNHEACEGCRINTMGQGAGFPINWIQRVSAERASGNPDFGSTVQPVKPVNEKTGTDSSDPVKVFRIDDLPSFIGGQSPDGLAIYQKKTHRGKIVTGSIVAFPAYRVVRIEQRFNGSLVFIDVGGIEHVIEMQYVNHKNSLARVLGKCGVNVINMQANLRYYQEFVESVGGITLRMDPVAGWSRDMSAFNTMSACIRKNSESEIALEDPPLNGNSIGVEGTLSGWRNAVDVIRTEKVDLLVFATMLGFASPLLKLVNISHNPAALVSYYHPDTGKGKSTCLRLANSVFMKPVETNIGFDDTDGSSFKSLGVMRNLFCSIDEMTSRITDPYFNATKFVNTLMQGFERGRLTAQSTQMERASWRTIVGISTNAPINEQLAMEEALGGLARVHEVYFDKLPLPKFQADSMLDGLNQNHGHAGPEFIRQLLNVTDFKSETNRRYERWKNSLSAAASGTADNAHRFVESLFAYVLTATEFSNDFQITNFDTKGLFDWCVKELDNRVQSNQIQIQRTEVTPSDFFNFIRHDIHSSRGIRMYESESSLRESRHPVFFHNDMLFFTSASFEAWRNQHKYRRGLLDKWIALKHVSDSVKRRNFKMMGHPLAKQNYYRLYLKSIMSDEDLAELNALEATRT